MIDHIHQSNLVEGFDSEEADECLMRAWKYLEKLDSIGLGDICRAQKIATLHQKDMRPDWRGYFRHVSGQRVWIGGREGLDPTKVPDAMKLWLTKIWIESPKDAHVEFEKIHPFVDGNGRTGRLVMWWTEKKLGMEPTLIEYNNRQNYYEWFREKLTVAFGT